MESMGYKGFRGSQYILEYLYITNSYSTSHHRATPEKIPLQTDTYLIRSTRAHGTLRISMPMLHNLPFFTTFFHNLRESAFHTCITQNVISTASIAPMMKPTVKHSNMAHFVLFFSIMIYTTPLVIYSWPTEQPLW